MIDLRLFFIACFLSLNFYSRCQNACTIDSLMNYVGKWKKMEDENMQPVPDQQKVISRIDKLQKIVQSASPRLSGIEAHWERNMEGIPLIKPGPFPYELSVGFFISYCDRKTNRILPADETGTWLRITANSFAWFLNELENLTFENSPLYLLPIQTGEFKGVALYEGKPEYSNAAPTVFSKTATIFRRGDFPYMPVSKKQYLVAFIDYFEKKKSKEIETANRKGSPSEIKELINKDYDDILQPAKEKLQSIGEEGDQIAYLEENYTEQFVGFGKGKGSGRMVVRLKQSYFKKNLPYYVPQLLIMRWEWDNLKQTINWKDQLEQQLDISALQNMLDN